MQLGDANSVSPANLRGLTRYLTGTTDDTSAFPDTEIDPLLNKSNKELQGEILEELFGNKWREKGKIYQDDLVKDKQEYLFPSDILTNNRMEVNYENGTNTWVVANPKKMDNIKSALSNIENQNPVVCSRSNPCYWLYDRRSFWLDPVAKTTVTDGVRIWFSSLVSDLNNETDEPVYIGFAHSILAYDSAIVYCLKNEKWNRYKALKEERAELFSKVINFYRKRNQDLRPRIVPKNLRRRII